MTVDTPALENNIANKSGSNHEYKLFLNHAIKNRNNNKKIVKNKSILGKNKYCEYS